MNVRLIALTFRASFTAGALVLFTAAAVLAQSSQVIRGEYIIQRKPLALGAAVAASASTNYAIIGASVTAQLVRPMTKGRAYVSSQSTFEIVSFDPMLAHRDCEEIRKDPSVDTCEPNFIVHNGVTTPDDPLFNSINFPFQFNLFLPGASPATGVFDTQAIFGWDKTVGSRSVVVGIVDSGINYEHPDLINNIWRNPNETVNGVDDDNNGYIDDIIGIDATNKNNNPFYCNGHGSHVAGIVGAEGNNGQGIAGVAWNVSLLMARNAIDCGPSVSVMSVITGLDYFYKLKRDSGINIVVVNGSYTGSNFVQAERDAIQRLGWVNIIFTAAAGNGDKNGVGFNIDASPVYPAGHDLPNIVSVANLDTSRDVYSTFFFLPSVINSSSNFGTTNVDLGAPGTDILSTVDKGKGSALFGTPGVTDYDLKTGTSMAAPTVAGAIALYKSRHTAHISYNRIIDDLLNSAFPIAVLGGKTKTGATLNINAFLSTQPTDNCPNDPSKLDPGFCGCGAAENYADSDSDGTPNCADSCANDPAKASAGVCGCGFPDTDSNGNGRVDCVDAFLGAVVPAKPSLSKKGKFKLSMTPSAEPGVIYVIRLESLKKSGSKKKKSGKTTTKFLSSTSPVANIKKPKKGETLKISYFYQIPGAAIFNSQESAAIKIKGK